MVTDFLDRFGTLLVIAGGAVIGVGLSLLLWTVLSLLWTVLGRLSTTLRAAAGSLGASFSRRRQK